MRKILLSIVVAIGVAGTAVATANPASARPWGWHHGWVGPGVALGLGLGLAAPYYDYYPAYRHCWLVRRWGPFGPHLVRVCRW